MGIALLAQLPKSHRLVAFLAHFFGMVQTIRRMAGVGPSGPVALVGPLAVGLPIRPKTIRLSAHNMALGFGYGKNDPGRILARHFTSFSKVLGPKMKRVFTHAE
jgi:hypothetical protein